MGCRSEYFSGCQRISVDERGYFWDVAGKAGYHWIFVTDIWMDMIIFDVFVQCDSILVIVRRC